MNYAEQYRVGEKHSYFLIILLLHTGSNTIWEVILYYLLSFAVAFTEVLHNACVLRNDECFFFIETTTAQR